GPRRRRAGRRPPAGWQMGWWRSRVLLDHGYGRRAWGGTAGAGQLEAPPMTLRQGCDIAPGAGGGGSRGRQVLCAVVPTICGLLHTKSLGGWSPGGIAALEVGLPLLE